MRKGVRSTRELILELFDSGTLPRNLHFTSRDLGLHIPGRHEVIKSAVANLVVEGALAKSNKPKVKRIGWHKALLYCFKGNEGKPVPDAGMPKIINYCIESY